MTRIGLWLALAHLAVVGLHGVAHAGLDLWPTPGEAVFIAVAIYGGPAAGAWLLRAGRERAGMALVGASLLASLAFATHHHFLVVSADHVAHLPPGAWRPVFQVTAVAAVPVDALGVAVAVRALVGTRRT
jgi:hypothetical protein